MRTLIPTTSRDFLCLRSKMCGGKGLLWFIFVGISTLFSFRSYSCRFVLLLCLISFDFFGQCTTMEWIDSELKRHSGPYKFSFLDPNFSYDYYKEEYKTNEVVKAAFLNVSGVKLNEKEYGSDSFLRSEWRLIQYGEEFHKYSYFKDRLTVIDTIKRVPHNYVKGNENNAHIVLVKGDTLYGVEKRVFYADKKLQSVHLLHSHRPGGMLMPKLDLPYGDSLFYYYDSCNNLLRTIKYHLGDTAIQNYSYEYPNLSERKGGTVGVRNVEEGTREKWKFSCDNKLVAIILLEESIFIKYAGNNVARYEHWMHDQGKEVKVTKRYEYDRNNILQTIRTTWGDITGDGDLLKVQNYRNGLTKIDAAGNSFIYSYKKR